MIRVNKHLSTEYDVIKEASLVKQLVHPCFPFVYGICTESKPYLLVMQFCNAEWKAYTLYKTRYLKVQMFTTCTWEVLTMQLNLILSNLQVFFSLSGINTVQSLESCIMPQQVPPSSQITLFCVVISVKFVSFITLWMIRSHQRSLQMMICCHWTALVEQ